ncbi:DUF2637 domain-containing protein [Streptomyces sp. NPDC091272]|uniref:DUF2637 domain-containing protein n=1 Tax=Streptomyces sp. NPDC091272 TaxID=3365981 RepID=UPI0038160BE5
MSQDRITQRTVTVVMAVIALLAFVFSFGNVWNLALRLGVPGPVAPLIAPMVDLSVVGLMVALRHLSLRGVPAEDLTGATRLMHVSGFFTLALNIAEPILAGHYGRACVDAVAPLLLLGWGAVGPTLLRHFHAVATPAPVVLPEPDRTGALPTPTPASAAEDTSAPPEAPAPAPVPAPAVAPPVEPAPAPAVPTPVAPAAPVPAAPVPAALLDAAREIADAHTTTHGTPITAPQLKARLGVSLPLATAAHAALTG